MSQWLTLAFEPSIVKRSVKVALLVGSLLMVINHGDVLLSGSLQCSHGIKVLLTFLVPYLVSTYSSVESWRAMHSSVAKNAKTPT